MKMQKNPMKNRCFYCIQMDISGIQNFIYSIGDKGALKGLRARSFYLEIMMEHIIDELLEKSVFIKDKSDLHRRWALLHAFTKYQ